FSNINQISIMNLEPVGWAKKNWDNLYISPDKYIENLNLAINMADISQLPIALFNYPLCHLPNSLWKYTIQSISDWKNYYPNECDQCKMKSHCGGYFSSSYGKYHQTARAIL
ncbi:His-Xaa-Ser system radical SAM maturase HxsC, partial [Proteus mirabilis]